METRGEDMQRHLPFGGVRVSNWGLHHRSLRGQTIFSDRLWSLPCCHRDCRALRATGSRGHPALGEVLV